MTLRSCAWVLGASALVACGGPSAKDAASAGGHTGGGRRDASATAEGDAGPVKICGPDEKDPRPCADDCDRGIATSCAMLADRTEHGTETVPRDATRAVALYERACDLHDAPSCVTAARMHAAGLGVPPSRQKQLDLLARACMLDDAFACAVPAKAFAAGIGVARDERRAADLRQRACAGGIESACPEMADAGP